MPRYSPIVSTIWHDKKFRHFSINAKILFIYMFSNESINLMGIYEFDEDEAKHRLSLEKSQFDAALVEIEQAGKIMFDREAGTLWVKSYFKYQAKSPQVLTMVSGDLNTVQPKFTQAFLEKYGYHFVNKLDQKGIPYLYRINTVCIPQSPNPIQTKPIQTNPIGSKPFESYLSKENIKTLKSLYNNDAIKIKNHLCNTMHIPEAEVDAALGKVF